MRRLSVSRFACRSVFLSVLVLAAVPLAQADDIVDHPDKLVFEELGYQPPGPDQYRHVLDCGAVAYVAEHHVVPTFELDVYVRTGSMYEPLDKAGLAGMTAYLMRNGGVVGMTATELNERLAFLAAEITVTISTSSGNADLFCLYKDVDEGLGLLRKILHDPVFDQEALDRYRRDILSDMEQRNASTSSIEPREWQFLMYGDHPSTNSRRHTEQSINSITREDLMSFHRKYFFPENFIFAVSGDFETDEILEKLNRMLVDWPSHELVLPEIPDEIQDPEPGVYMIEKEGVNQSRIRLGHIGTTRNIPDIHALMVMNEILGGGGFTSRIVSRVRSDEGLAYSVRSVFDLPIEYPGTFRAYFQTKHATAAFGTRLIVDEIKRIRTEKCAPGEIENAKSALIGELVNYFNTKNRMVNTFANDEYTDRPEGYWRNFTDNMNAVTAEDLLQTAQKYLHPEKLVFLVVGDVEAVLQGSEKHPESFPDFGEITILPLRDPMTLEIE